MHRRRAVRPDRGYRISRWNTSTNACEPPYSRADASHHQELRGRHDRAGNTYFYTTQALRTDGSAVATYAWAHVRPALLWIRPPVTTQGFQVPQTPSCRGWRRKPTTVVVGHPGVPHATYADRYTRRAYCAARTGPLECWHMAAHLPGVAAADFSACETSGLAHEAELEPDSPGHQLGPDQRRAEDRPRRRSRQASYALPGEGAPDQPVHREACRHRCVDRHLGVAQRGPLSPRPQP